MAFMKRIRSPAGVREPGPQPVEALHVVRREGARAARAGQMNSRNSLPSVSNHRVEPPAGIERSLYFPVPVATQPTPPLPMQTPADRRSLKGGYIKRANNARWIIYELPETLTIERHLWVFGIAAAHRGIGVEKTHASPTMRNDCVQQGRHCDHRALGLEPEAAQGLEMLDRPQSVPPALPRIRNNTTLPLGGGRGNWGNYLLRAVAGDVRN